MNSKIIENKFKENIIKTIEIFLPNIIRKLKNNKTPGIDNIENKFLKLCFEFDQENFKKMIYYIIINPIDRKLKKSKLCLFPKKKKINNPLETRPISLQNEILKICEKIILILINEHIEEKKLIIPEQTGF